MDQVLNAVQQLLVELGQLNGYLNLLVHPNLVVIALLGDSAQLSDVWSNYILRTTDVETNGGPFVYMVTIQRFEPKVQIFANAALALLTLWAAYRIMWGHGLRTQYTARILLPRLFMGVVLINFSLTLFQIAVDASNTISTTVQSFVQLDDPSTWAATTQQGPERRRPRNHRRSGARGRLRHSCDGLLRPVRHPRCAGDHRSNRGSVLHASRRRITSRRCGPRCSRPTS